MKHVIEVYQLERGKWRKLPLSSIVNGDEIVLGTYCRILVNGKQIYNSRAV